MEYRVMLSVPNADVGSYANTMQDLIGNLVNGTVFFTGSYVRSRM
jgi:hypothetical protein